MRTPPAFCVQFRRRYATRRSVSRVHPYVGGGMLLFAQCFAIPRLHCRRPVLGAPSAHGGVLPGYSARLSTWSAHRRRGLHHPRGISPLAAGGGILSSMSIVILFRRVCSSLLAGFAYVLDCRDASAYLLLPI